IGLRTSSKGGVRKPRAGLRSTRESSRRESAPLHEVDGLNQRADVAVHEGRVRGAPSASATFLAAATTLAATCASAARVSRRADDVVGLDHAVVADVLEGQHQLRKVD